MAANPSSNLSFENFFKTTLSQPVSTTDTTIYVANLPAGQEGFLVLEKDTASREIIFYSSKGANFVVCPSIADGRGQGGTSVTTHTAGTLVERNLVAEDMKALQTGKAFSAGIFSSLVTTFTNTGTGAGTFRALNLGGVKIMYGNTSNVGAAANGNGTWSLIFPVGFFTTVQHVNVSAINMVTVAELYANVGGLSGTASVSGFLSNRTGNTGNAGVSVFVIGT